VFPRNKKGEPVRVGGAQVFVKITYGLAVKGNKRKYKYEPNIKYKINKKNTKRKRKGKNKARK
jgi:hypothetical protein